MSGEGVHLTPEESAHIAEVLNRADEAQVAYMRAVRSLNRARIGSYICGVAWSISLCLNVAASLTEHTPWWLWVVVVLAGVITAGAGALLAVTWNNHVNEKAFHEAMQKAQDHVHHHPDDEEPS